MRRIRLVSVIPLISFAISTAARSDSTAAHAMTGVAPPSASVRPAAESSPDSETVLIGTDRLSANADTWQNCYKKLAYQMLSATKYSGYTLNSHFRWVYSVNSVNPIFIAHGLPSQVIAWWYATRNEGSGDQIKLVLHLMGGKGSKGGYECFFWPPVLKSDLGFSHFYIKNARGRKVAKLVKTIGNGIVVKYFE